VFTDTVSLDENSLFGEVKPGRKKGFGPTKL
jgi:hypothetical protein